LIPINRFLILSIASLTAVGFGLLAKETKRFQAGPPSQYAHQQSENVSVGAKPFDNDELVNSAFGKKIDFSKYGVVPVLIVIENKRDKALDLTELEASLVAADGRHVNAVAPENLVFLGTQGKHPSPVGVHTPIPLPKKKNPLNSPAIVERAFAAKMLPPGDSASGFLYFEAKAEAGDKLYLNGLRDARSGQQLLYFEFPLTRKLR
jgi:hypothetical protein